MGQTITVQLHDDDSTFDAYLAEPDLGEDTNNGATKGGVVLIHEIWGLVDHIRDVADRLAGQGYQVLAPDLLSSAGITSDVVKEVQSVQASADPAERSRLQPLLREKMAPLQAPEYAAWAIRALTATVDRLAEQPGVDRRIGVIGFCFGGSYAFALAAADPRIRAAIPFYGAPPDSATLSAIKCPVLAFYGDQDERLMDGLPKVREEMAAAGVDFTAQVYSGVGHAFFNNENRHGFDPDSAQDAWSKSLDLLARSLQ